MKSKPFLSVLAILILILSLVNCQYSEDEEVDEEYDEEISDGKGGKVTKVPSSSLNSKSQNSSTTSPRQASTTLEDDEAEETSTQALDYIFKPVNSILQNVQKGNITGIVDMALSIRAPPAVRDLVNSIMKMVFGAGQAVTDSIAQAYAPAATSPPTVDAAEVPASRSESSSALKSSKNDEIRNNNNTKPI